MDVVCVVYVREVHVHNTNYYSVNVQVMSEKSGIMWGLGPRPGSLSLAPPQARAGDEAKKGKIGIDNAYFCRVMVLLGWMVCEQRQRLYGNVYICKGEAFICL